jgi:hypothetical protein
MVVISLCERDLGTRTVLGSQLIPESGPVVRGLGDFPTQEWTMGPKGLTSQSSLLSLLRTATWQLLGALCRQYSVQVATL